MGLLAAAFGLVFLWIALIGWQMRDGSFRRPSHEPEMVFRSRLPLGLVFPAFGLPTLFLFSAFSPDAIADNNRTIFIIYAVLAVVFTLPLLLMLPVIQCVVLNKERLTYRLRTGGMLRPVVRSGSCRDLAGIYVREHSRGPCVVCLASSDAGKEDIMLGFYSRRAKADALAGEVARAAGLQVIAPPTLRGR